MLLPSIGGPDHIKTHRGELCHRSRNGLENVHPHVSTVFPILIPDIAYLATRLITHHDVWGRKRVVVACVEVVDLRYGDCVFSRTMRMVSRADLRAFRVTSET